MPRYTINDLKAFAKQKGGDCLSEKYTNNNATYTWKCENGHVFDKVWLTVKTRGSWCQECLNNNGIESVKKFAEEKGGRCLSEKFVRGDTKYNFVCKNGHEFVATWNVLKFGRKAWCEKCRAITIEQLQEHAKALGGECLSTEYSNIETKYTWQCEAGHVWQATWLNVKHGLTWCKQCRTYAFEDIEELAKNNGGHCTALVSGTGISGTYIFECEKGHFWQTTGSNVKNGTWCKECQKLDLSIAQEEAKKHGGKCLDVKYINRRHEMLWECEFGHQFHAPLGRIRNNGAWCRECCIDSVRLDISVPQQIAVERGGKCLSETYLNVGTPLLWECSRGHTWYARLGNIANGSWCNKCVMIQRREKCLDRLYVWIDKMGGIPVTPKEEISREETASVIRVRLKCSRKHTFERTLAYILRGGWCPHCRYQSEEVCRTILEEIYQLPFPKQHPAELEGLELDGYCRELGIAFEYDGQQHTDYIPFFHRNGIEDLKKIQARDNRKDELCLDNNIFLVRIPHTLSYDKPDEIRKYIQEQLKLIQE